MLLDLGMPDVGGEAVLAELRRSDPDARVVLSSGYPEAYVGGDAPGEKPSAFLPKPYRLGDLARTLRRVLDDSAGSDPDAL